MFTQLSPSSVQTDSGPALDMFLGQLDAEEARSSKHRFDDDMSSGDEAPLIKQTLVPGKRKMDDISPTPLAAPGLSVPTLRQPSVAVQMAECKARIAELQRDKDYRLTQEDYMGAHEVKQQILEQEQKLQALRLKLDSMPTPARLVTAAVASPARGPRVSIAVGPRRRSIAPGTVSLEAAEAAVAAARPDEKDVPMPAADKVAAPDQVQVDDDDDQEEEQVDGSEAASEEAGSWRPVQGQPNLLELQGEEVSALPAPFRLPVDIFDRLYDYQRTGVAWMARMMQKGHGGVLADEMGLGKTIQVCALLNGARKAGATHALLLLPVTLLDQWVKEARIWCPGWPVYTYYGTAIKRARALRAIRRPQGGLLVTSYSLLGNTEDLFEVQVEDVPEPVRRRGRPEKTGPSKRRKYEDDDVEDGVESEEEPQEPELPPCDLPELGTTKPWDLVVCDEAHRMKNISTLLGKSLRKLKSKSRILLTGTPVQNALQDLWSLMDFAQPGLLGNHATFVKTFSEPIDRGSVRGAKVWAVELKKHLSEQLRGLISPHLLRRTKVGAGLMGEGVIGDGSAAEDVSMEDGATEDGEAVEGQIKKLPPKKETIVWLYPSPEQLLLYQKVLENSEIIKEASTKSKLSIEVFRAVGLLKRLCNHPMLLLPCPKPSVWRDILAQVQADVPAVAENEAGASEASASEAVKEADEQAASENLGCVAGATGAAADQQDDARAGKAVELLLNQLPRGQKALLEQSAKLRCLSVLLPELAARGHRTLVFSQSVKMLDLVQILCLKPHGLRCLRIDGQTDAASRNEKVQKFNKQPDRFQCMLLTTSVGGVGLNLTSADRVVLVDPAWNPATDAQAVDRAFRIGQTKEVRVYRLIMSGLMEDKMFRLQVFKMGLTRTALEADQQQRYFTAREIRALFEWTDPSQGETRQLLLDKHGEEAESSIKDAAIEDGAEKDEDAESGGWLKAGPAVGLSDFTCLFTTGAQEEEEKDENFSAQVQEAKQKLSAADDKLQMKQKEREEAEANRDRLAKELEDVNASLEHFREKRLRSDELLKEKRAELVQARRFEQAAQIKLDKATKVKGTTQERLNQAQQVLDSANEASEVAAKSSSDAQQGARSAEEAFSKVLGEAEAQLKVVNESGQAVGNGAADAAKDKLRKATQALKQLHIAIENSLTRQVEYESTEEELAKADQGLAEAEAALAQVNGAASDGPEAAAQKRQAEMNQRSRDRERQRLEQLQAKAQQKSEASRETVLQAVQNFIEAGMVFADSFTKTQSRPVKMDQVKAAQTTSKAAFRPLSSAWSAVIKARQVQGKASVQRRKVSSKASAAFAAKVEAELQAASAERELADATAEESQLRDERVSRESELSEAEASKAAVEAEDAETKRRREELKAVVPVAKEAVKAARAAEKEAANERQALHNTCNKREKEQLQLEEAKNTAVKTLMNEQYDATQVEQAYQQKKKVVE